MRKTFLPLSSIAFLSFFTISCFKSGGNCEEPLNVNESKIIIGFKNASGEYLHAETNPTYNKDSLMIFDEIGNKYFLPRQLDVIPNTVSRYWKFDFGPIYNVQTDGEAFNREICKKFFIKYNHNESDTITTCFKAFKTKCGSEFSSLKIYHKGILLNEEDNNIFINVEVTKK